MKATEKFECECFLSAAKTGRKKRRTIKMDLEPASIVIELRREAVY